MIDRAPLGFDGENAPDQAPSKKQRKKRLKALKKASQKCVSTNIAPLLLDTIAKDMPKGLQWSIEPDPDDTDAQTLLFAYPTAFTDHPAYLRQVVKIELGARSDTDPSQVVEIKPIICAEFPELFPESRFPVRVVEPVRTFWEKAMMLHEETFRPLDRKKRKRGMARHYYDLYMLIKKGVADKTATDQNLFQRIAEHREVYFRYTWVDYSTMKQGSLRLIPPAEHLPEWKRDYTDMQSEMFYGDVPDFDEVINKVGQFQDYFNKRV